MGSTGLAPAEPAGNVAVWARPVGLKLHLVETDSKLRPHFPVVSCLANEHNEAAHDISTRTQTPL